MKILSLSKDLKRYYDDMRERKYLNYWNHHQLKMKTKVTAVYWSHQGGAKRMVLNSEYWNFRNFRKMLFSQPFGIAISPFYLQKHKILYVSCMLYAVSNFMRLIYMIVILFANLSSFLKDPYSTIPTVFWFYLNFLSLRYFNTYFNFINRYGELATSSFLSSYQLYTKPPSSSTLSKGICTSRHYKSIVSPGSDLIGFWFIMGFLCPDLFSSCINLLASISDTASIRKWWFELQSCDFEILPLHMLSRFLGVSLD